MDITVPFPACFLSCFLCCVVPYLRSVCSLSLLCLPVFNWPGGVGGPGLGMGWAGQMECLHRAALVLGCPDDSSRICIVLWFSGLSVFVLRVNSCFLLLVGGGEETWVRTGVNYSLWLLEVWSWEIEKHAYRRPRGLGTEPGSTLDVLFWAVVWCRGVPRHSWPLGVQVHMVPEPQASSQGLGCGMRGAVWRQLAHSPAWHLKWGILATGALWPHRWSALEPWPAPCTSSGLKARAGYTVCALERGLACLWGTEPHPVLSCPVWSHPGLQWAPFFWCFCNTFLP